MLGLNISASFNSAVTIYILIPVLIIPQLLLSGVVIGFDKFNPKVGKPIGIPLIGEMMASRWAFEASMVTQFKDNPFERQFYEVDKVIALAEYKRVYYIPKLESELAYCLTEHRNWRNKQHQPLASSLSLLQNEIVHELTIVGKPHFPEVEKLTVGKFDSLTYKKMADFLTTLKVFYTLKMNRAFDEKERRINDLTNTPEKKMAFESMRRQYVNASVTDAVKNINTAERIVEWKGELIQKIYPIYQDDHRPENPFDFSANLYQPTKHFLGSQFNTFYFNITVIWVMTLILFITLYFDILRILIRLLEGNRKYRRRERKNS